MNKLLKEPLLHICNDSLPDNHPLVLEGCATYCNQCNEMLVASHNEMMQAWIETGIGDFCMECFIHRYYKSICNEEIWALKEG